MPNPSTVATHHPASVPSPELVPRQRAHRAWLAVLSEAALMLLCCALLWQVAEPLTVPNPTFGLGNRYQDNILPALVMDVPFWQQYIAVGVFSPFTEDRAARAIWLHQHVGQVLILVGIGGWLALWLGRWRQRLTVRLPAIAALWGGVGYAIAAWSGRGLTQSVVAGFWLTLVVAGLVGTLLALRWPRQHGAGQSQTTILTAVPCIYPGWVLFGGLGCLWLIDFAARGYLKMRFYGVSSVDAWFIASATLSVVAAAAPTALAMLCRWLNRFDSGRWGASLPLLGSTLLWLVAVLGLTWVVLPYLLASWHPIQHAATIAEALRVPVWIMLAWIAYRWVESGLRPLSGLLATSLLLMMLVLALWAGKDKGPILVQAVAVVVMLGGMMAATLNGRRWLPAGLIAGVIVVALGLLTLGWLLFLYAPPDRLAVLAHPHQGKLEFLSEIHWFMHAVPAQGFGLTHIPWCGYAGSLGIASCAGVPQQIQSDYVFAALVGVFGPQQAVLLIALLLLWLGAMVLSQGRRIPGAVFDMSSFVTWLIASGATAYAVQTVISCLGTLGAIPLTGVSVPMFAYGGASLMTLSLLTGLAVNRLPVATQGNSAAARTHSSLS